MEWVYENIAKRVKSASIGRKGKVVTVSYLSADYKLKRLSENGPYLEGQVTVAYWLASRKVYHQPVWNSGKLTRRQNDENILSTNTVKILQLLL